MQANATPQRQSQLPSQTPTDLYRTTRTNMDNSQASGSQPRSSSGTARAHSGRTTNPDKQISQIEKSVTHLLVATKQLLETLTQWSRGNSQEEEVSDVYVRLGYEFNLACRAFNSIGVETSDLGPVPDLLRSILEDTLSQPASPQALDNYLPRIRDIIINLLHGLKRKQSKLRSRSTKDGAGKSQVTPVRQSSATGASNSEVTPTSALEGTIGSASSVRSESRQGSVVSNEEQSWPQESISRGTAADKTSLHRQSVTSTGREIPMSGLVSSLTHANEQNTPTVGQPVDPDKTAPISEVSYPHPPPPPPKQDALTALQRGGDLERRASRRFSAYQIQKHLGTSSNGVPVLPPAQNSPIPNRGREVRESMNAVRSRTSYQNTRQRSANRLAEVTPGSPGNFRGTERISEERDETPATTQSEAPRGEYSADPTEGPDSPTAKTPDEFERPRMLSTISNGGPVFAATVSGPLSPAPEVFNPSRNQERANTAGSSEHELATATTPKDTAFTMQQTSPDISTPRQNHAVNSLDSSPSQGKELTLFLQYKSKIKKFVLADGYEELTIARLQLAFIEKFNWNTHNNGVDLPEIYIQDPVSGVRHELEDLNDVKDRSVLVLNVEVLDEVKKHFDEGIGGLRTTLEGVRSLLDGQGSMMQRFSDRQLESAKEMARLSTMPTPRPARTPISAASPGGIASPLETSATEVQILRRDIAVLRQTYSTMSSDFQAAMKDIKAKAESVKATAHQAAAPSYEGDAGRAHVNKGKKTLSTESELLVNRVDDLQDAIEDLRKDVVTRGVRPLPRQLEELNREISATTRDVAKMKEFMKREKPVWTKIWEHELDLVCTERDELTNQEDLMADLDRDLEAVTNVLGLVEEATKQQNLQSGGQASLRPTPKMVEIDTSGVDPRAAKDGVLGDVRALRPNHESRLEAIERAEKIRLKELESRKGGEFQREVEKFVEEGKLKKTGGMEEVERLRKIKDERARKENFERQQARTAEMERKRAEEAAAAVAASEAASADRENESLGEHDSSQGDISFQDAPEASPVTTTTTPVTTHDDYTSPLSTRAASSLSTTSAHNANAQDRMSNQPETSAQESHQSPSTSRNGEGEDKSSESATPATANSDSQSWWKPAIFTNP